MQRIVPTVAKRRPQALRVPVELRERPETLGYGLGSGASQIWQIEAALLGKWRVDARPQQRSVRGVVQTRAGRGEPLHGQRIEILQTGAEQPNASAKRLDLVITTFTGKIRLFCRFAAPAEP